jgi:hypothetical protein
MAAPSLAVFVWRVVAAHVVTYFVAGLIASTVFDYHALYQETELRHLMRPTTTAWVAAGPLLQIVRGVVFGFALWPLRTVLLDGARGAFRLWCLLVALAIWGAAGPAPGSLEGMIFTTLPLRLHLLGWPEVIVQTGAFAALLSAWCHGPRRSFNVAAVIALVVVALLSALGVAAALGVLPPSGASVTSML